MNPIGMNQSNPLGEKKSKEAPKIWENLLKSVSSGRRLAEKQLLVLGTVKPPNSTTNTY
jgi:hypothetical protein